MPTAASPHPLELYRWAVQDPTTHAALLTLIYRHLRGGHDPRLLREDFAGTSADSAAWVSLGPDRRAVAVDLDTATLDWAARRARAWLGPASARIDFVHGDAREIQPPRVPPADVLSALNFGLCYFHTRPGLLGYLRRAHAGLAPGGLLVANLFGGPTALRPHAREHRVTPPPTAGPSAPPGPGAPTDEPRPPPFTYRWVQGPVNPVTSRVECRIHFRLDDGDDQPDAFVYDWRLWSIPELIDALREAGFADARAWRHTYDPSKGAAGVFLGPVDAFDPPDLWTAYVVATR